VAVFNAVWAVFGDYFWCNLGVVLWLFLEQFECCFGCSLGAVFGAVWGCFGVV